MPPGVIPKPPSRLPARPPLPPRLLPKPPPGPPPALKKTPPPLPPRPPKLEEIPPPPPELEEDIPPPPEEDFVPPPPPGHRRNRAITERDEVIPPPPPEPPASADRGTLVDPALFSVLERYTQASRNAAEKGFGRMFSTRPGAKAVAPTNAATPQQLNAAGNAIGLVSQIADVTAKIAGLDALSAGETSAQQEAVANRARAAVWEKSGVPVDLRPMKSGVLGAEVSKNRLAFQEERLKARDKAQKEADKVNKGLVTKERAEKASLPASDAGKAAGWTVLGILKDVAPSAPSLDSAISAAAKANTIGYKAWSTGKNAADPLVKAMGHDLRSARQRAGDRASRHAAADRGHPRRQRRRAVGPLEVQARRRSRSRHRARRVVGDRGLQGGDRYTASPRPRRSARSAARWP